MRCEDCLPLVEEYFDGEVEETTAARMGAHLAACATCASALDALSFEQEIYARYDRGGLEVTPDLWSRVSAEIAHDPLPSEQQDARRPFLSRLRGQLAAGLAAFAVRPALASSLALLLIGVTAGSLWLARRTPPVATSLVAENTPVAGVVPAPVMPVAAPSVNAPTPESSDVAPLDAHPAVTEPLRVDSRAAAAEGRSVTPAPAAAAEDDVMTLLASANVQQASPGIVVITPDEHAPEDDTAALFVNASAPARDTAARDARLLDPSEKEMARHLEQTQMLLRSFKNARASEAGSLDVAYEKDLSRKLLAENATLKLEADVKGDKDTRQVLEQIEPFLLDIANLRENPSRDEVRSIKERVRKNEIVAALQVY